MRQAACQDAHLQGWRRRSRPALAVCHRPAKPPHASAAHPSGSMQARARLDPLLLCRQETVVATSDLECYTLDRATFHSLLGPVEDLWRFEALRKVR